MLIPKSYILYSKTFPFIAHVKNNRKNNDDNNGRHNPQNRLFDMYVCMYVKKRKFVVKKKTQSSIR